MTKIYLIRHAEAEGNLYRIAQGQDNSALTDRGWRQVRALERRFAEIQVDAVYSSDLYRTCATAGALYLPKELPLQKRRDLREICVGVWEQRTWGDIYRTDPVQMGYFSHEFTKCRIEGAESAAQVLSRVRQAVEEIAAKNENRTVAVFSHGYAIRVLLADLQGYSLEEAGATPHGDNTAVSLLEWENGAFRVVFRDDNSHLQTAEYLAGEKVRKRSNALEPGLWFAPLRLPEQAGLFAELVEAVWQESENREPFDPKRLLTDGAERTTLIGYREEEPVGVVQLGQEPGCIALACIRADQRKRGYGVQLIGQAVMHHRPRGAEFLRVTLAAESPARAFFEDNGFCPAGERPGGCILLEKDIRFDPRFL